MMAAKNYLITGAGRGIGRGLSRHLLQQGNRVILLHNNVAELTNTASLLSGKGHTRGRDFETIECNLRQPSEITSAAKKTGEFFDHHLDCLINNAACQALLTPHVYERMRPTDRDTDTRGVGGEPVSSLSLETWTASLETNLTAPMLLTQACLPLLRKTPSRTGTGGSVVFISSTRAFMSEPNNEPYSATKAGLLGLSQAMAVSLADDGIRTNVIVPGWIHVEDECAEADARGKQWEEGLSAGDQRWHLSGRVGKVEDVARAVEYLVAAEFATGSEVVVDGGVTRKMVYPE